MKRRMIALAFVGSFGACATTGQPPTLYQRIGGQERIAAVANDLVDNAVADWRIGRRFADTDIVRLKQTVAGQICAASGGPCAYTGRDMKTAHANLAITEFEFAAFTHDLATALRKSKVPLPEQQELLAIFDSMKADVIGR